jgi:3-hydroxyacyl-[acyl-carrier-protein] dehydratase
MLQRLGKEQIESLLPHRDDAQMLDFAEWDSTSPDEIRAIKHVHADEPHCRGHFPEMAIFPGHCQVECLNLAAALLARMKHPEIQGLPIVASIKETKFLERVVPGDSITFTVHLDREIVRRIAIFTFSGQAHRESDGRLVTTVEEIKGVSGISPGE